MLANPAVVYICAWSLSLFLYSLDYSNIFLELSDLTVRYIYFSMLSVGLTWLFFTAWTGTAYFTYKKSSLLTPFSEAADRKIIILLYIWCAFSLLELLYFRDLPVLSLVGLSSMSYHDYGIPSLHGFLNAILLSLSMYSLYKLLETGKRKYLGFYLLTLIAPILIMNRGGLVSLLIESFFVFVVFKKIHWLSFGKFAVLLIGFLFVFAWLGELRNVSGSEQLYDVFQISDNYPPWMPKGFIWVYMYLTSSLNNVENMIGTYADLNFEPYYVLFSFFPTVIRDMLPPPNTVDLVVSAFNVSSFMPNYLSAFGFYGTFIFYFLASLVPMYVYYKFVQTKRLSYGFALVIFLHSIALSIFSDFFFIQVYVFQVLLQFIVFMKIRASEDLRCLIIK